MAESEPRERLEQALELAYRYLNRRERTEAEVRSHLATKRIAAPVVEQAMNTLTDQGYVNDARFARLLAEDKRELAQWGSERIRGTLAARGVERELIEEALRRPESEGELDRAVALLRRRFPAPPADRRERERALGVLLRRGYDRELALAALAVHASESGSGRFARPRQRYYDASSERMAPRPLKLPQICEIWIPDCSVDGI
ncbi:MAG: RecX family transcriptional regulator [Solirubrobacterales bacterium]|nr:RecX family transcriptional regulator [Solirubrobacterales bacterium]MBV9715644.1 RecX family transcriptional regulator [Solirubrobacterales bacterium]